MTLISKRDSMGRILAVAKQHPNATCLHCSKSFPVDRPGVKFCSVPCKFRIRETQEHFVGYFWSRVTKTEGCWPWRGKSNGLHAEAWRRGKRILAHRAAWEIANGAIPKGMFVCHKCDNPPCVRPDHLFLGTPQDNNKDMATKNRSSHGSRNGQSKLTEQDVAALKTDYADGIKQRLIAEKYGVSRATVQRIVYGKGWVRVQAGGAQ